MATRGIDWLRTLTPSGVGAILPTHISLLELKGDTSRFSSHSLRRGGATMFARAKLDAKFIKLLGRWDSDVYEEYTDPTWTGYVSELKEALVGAAKRL